MANGASFNTELGKKLASSELSLFESVRIDFKCFFEGFLELSEKFLIRPHHKINVHLYVLYDMVYDDDAYLDNQKVCQGLLVRLSIDSINFSTLLNVSQKLYRM